MRTPSTCELISSLHPNLRTESGVQALILEGHSSVGLGLGMKGVSGQAKGHERPRNQESREYSQESTYLMKSPESKGSSSRSCVLCSHLTPRTSSSTMPTSLDLKSNSTCVYSKRRPSASYPHRPGPATPPRRVLSAQSQGPAKGAGQAGEDTQRKSGFSSPCATSHSLPCSLESVGAVTGCASPIFLCVLPGDCPSSPLTHPNPIPSFLPLKNFKVQLRWLPGDD